MNTKQYLKMFAELADKDEIPRDLYDLMISEIAKDRGRMTKRVYNIYLDELEKRRLFFADGAPFDTKNSAKTDGTYIYKHTKNPFWYIGHAIWATLAKAIGYFGGAVVFGVWRVKDRKKMKGLGACITVSNHVGYLDVVLTRRANGSKKLYAMVAPHNCKSDLGGAIFRAIGALPVPISAGGGHKFNEMLEYLVAKKAKIHVYAEQSMWLGYEKPRPYKPGAFFYASRLDIPVVPMLYCFKKPRGLRKLLHLPKAVIKIGDPIYPDKDLPPVKRKDDMKARAEQAVKEIYERFYGVPLVYKEPDAEVDTSADPQ